MMNTYQVAYYPPGATAPVVVTVQAVHFDYMPDVVSFVNQNNEPVFAVPTNLLPVITLTVAA